MKHLESGLELNSVEKEINRLLDGFEFEERLSDFERGQLDGLRWALDVINDIKNPPHNENHATGENI
jgi:hypothetical protein